MNTSVLLAALVMLHFGSVPDERHRFLVCARINDAGQVIAFFQLTGTKNMKTDFELMDRIQNRVIRPADRSWRIGWIPIWVSRAKVTPLVGSACEPEPLPSPPPPAPPKNSN